jgi:hypothetical protein
MENKGADVLSCRVTLLFIISVEVIGLERLKKKYESCLKFIYIYIYIYIYIIIANKHT